MSNIDVTKLVKDVMNDTMERAFYLQTKAFFEKNNEHITEICRLKAEVERLRNLGIKLESMIDPLKAEVERLRKAGDLLCFHYISLARKRWPDDPLPSSVTAWNAAKEGKPSA